MQWNARPSPLRNRADNHRKRDSNDIRDNLSFFALGERY
jgi:hypothetical protein